MGRTAQLRAALKKRFFPKVEAEGFVRDEPDEALFSCFRRKAGSVVQVFYLQWEKHGLPCFRVHFAEAPIEGFDYLGTHVAAEEARPSHFTLPRGSLIPSCGVLARRWCILTGSWFQLDRPLFSRLTSGQRDYEPDYVVGQLLTLFPEVLAWWESKIKGKHIRVAPPMPKDTHEKLKQQRYAKLKQNADRAT